MRGNIIAAILLTTLTGGSALPADVDHRRLRNADSEPGQWFTVGRGYDEQRYSPLTRINTGNVSQLTQAWSVQLTAPAGRRGGGAASAAGAAARGAGAGRGAAPADEDLLIVACYRNFVINNISAFPDKGHD